MLDEDEDLAFLDGLSEDELLQLSFQVDPEQSLLTASERCSYKKKTPDTRMYQREHLMDFMEKLAARDTPAEDQVPYKRKELVPVVGDAPVRRRPSPLPTAQLSQEESDELSQMTETELIELAAYIGATNMLTQEQIHAVELGKRPEGSAFRKTTVVKSSVLNTKLPKEPEQDLDVLTLKRALKEGKVTVVTINNQPELEGDVFDEILMSLDENDSLRHLSLANTGMTDKVAKPLVESIECNSVLETLNLESNYVSPETLLELVKVVGENKTLRELRIANQKVRLGLRYEEKIATALETNDVILRIGLTVENAGPRNKIDRILIRNNDTLRQARQEGKTAYNFNDVKKYIKEASQPWLKTRGIFSSGELCLDNDGAEDGDKAEPMSRLKKTGYVYGENRPAPKVNLYEEEGITAEEATMIHAQQVNDEMEKEAKQSEMLGELTEMLAKRKSRMSTQGEQEHVAASQQEDEQSLAVVRHDDKAASPTSVQRAVQEEMQAALLARQQKILAEEEQEVNEEEVEREERRRRRQRGRRRNDDGDDDDVDGTRDAADQHAIATPETGVNGVDSSPRMEQTDEVVDEEGARERRRTRNRRTRREEEDDDQDTADAKRQTDNEQRNDGDTKTNDIKQDHLDESDSTERQQEGESAEEAIGQSPSADKETSKQPDEVGESKEEDGGQERSQRRRQQRRTRERDEERNEEQEEPSDGLHKAKGESSSEQHDRSEASERQQETRDKEEEDEEEDEEGDERRTRRRRRTRAREEGEEAEDDDASSSERARPRRERRRETSEGNETANDATQDKDTTHINDSHEMATDGQTIQAKSTEKVELNNNNDDNSIDLERPMSLRERRRLRQGGGGC